MQPTLIILRGNSGSGKTALAKNLQQYFGTDKCLLVQQDVLRREILHASDHPNTPAIDFIETIVKFGYQHYPVVILEGILRKDVYGEMLIKLCKTFTPRVLVYYLDVSFETTLKFNVLKKTPFSESDLHSWWLDSDYLTNSDYKLNAVGTANLRQQVITDYLKFKE